MALTSISRFCAANLGGLQLVEYAPVSWIDASAYQKIISDTWNWQKAIPFQEGYDWLSIYLLPARRLWSERQVNGEYGPSFDQSIEGILPSMRPEVSLQLAEMTGYRYILRLTDRNAKTWLIGTKDEGLEFVSEATTGEQNGLNNYLIRFTGQSSERAYGYAPVL